LFLVPFT